MARQRPDPVPGATLLGRGLLAEATLKGGCGCVGTLYTLCSPSSARQSPDGIKNG